MRWELPYSSCLSEFEIAEVRPLAKGSRSTSRLQLPHGRTPSHRSTIARWTNNAFCLQQQSPGCCLRLTHRLRSRPGRDRVF